MADVTSQTKKVTRRKAFKQVPAETVSEKVSSQTPKSLSPEVEIFADLVTRITQSQLAFERLQKQIEEVKQSWDKEKMDHDVEVAERNRQEELQRQRNRDEYLYETARERKKAEDEFADRKVIWEKELRDQKEAIENDRRELERLRKLVEDFEVEKEKAVEVAKASVQGQLMANFASEKKLREQEFKAEKDVFNLKINTLSSENARLINEIATLKQSLDEATRQLKEVAVKIIESRGNLSKTSQLE